MTTMKFDQLPTQIEETNVADIGQESVKQAWKTYESKAEYKDFNKHDMIESMLQKTDQDKQ